MMGVTITSFTECHLRTVMGRQTNSNPLKLS
jgi:hypothetical protein